MHKLNNGDDISCIGLDYLILIYTYILICITCITVYCDESLVYRFWITKLFRIIYNSYCFFYSSYLNMYGLLSRHKL